MNILLWILQILLALHTAIGAIWKFTNSEQAVPSLNLIPHSVWMALLFIELLCSLGLVLPLFKKKFASVAPLSAWVIAGEMVLFCGVHIASGDPDFRPMIYWFLVFAFCVGIALGRSVRRSE